MISRINSELANDLGNLAQRVLSMIGRYCEGILPSPGPFTDADDSLNALASSVIEDLRKHMDNQAFNDGLEAIWTVVRAANSYVDHQAPWQLHKNDTARRDTVLYVLVETIRHLGLYIQPYMPDSGNKMLDMLSVQKNHRDYYHIGPDHALRAGLALPKPEPIFPRVEENGTVG